MRHLAYALLLFASVVTARAQTPELGNWSADFTLPGVHGIVRGGIPSDSGIWVYGPFDFPDRFSGIEYLAHYSVEHGWTGTGRSLYGNRSAINDIGLEFLDVAPILRDDGLYAAVGSTTDRIYGIARYHNGCWSAAGPMLPPYGEVTWIGMIDNHLAIGGSELSSSTTSERYILLKLVDDEWVPAGIPSCMKGDPRAFHDLGEAGILVEGWPLTGCINNTSRRVHVRNDSLFSIGYNLDVSSAAPYGDGVAMIIMPDPADPLMVVFDGYSFDTIMQGEPLDRRTGYQWINAAPDGTLYVVAGGTSYDSLFTFDEHGWNLLRGRFSGLMMMGTELPDGTPVALGSIRSADQRQVYGLALHQEGEWRSPEIEGNIYNGLAGEVRAVAFFDGRLWVGGQRLSPYPSTQTYSLLAYDYGEAKWDTAIAQPRTTIDVRDLAVSDLAVVGDSLIVGGCFTSIGTETFANIAIYTDGAWQGMGMGTTHCVEEIEATSQRIVVAGPEIDPRTSKETPHLTYWDRGAMTGPILFDASSINAIVDDVDSIIVSVTPYGVAAPWLYSVSGTELRPWGTRFNMRNLFTRLPGALVRDGSKLLYFSSFRTLDGDSVAGTASFDEEGWHLFRDGRSQTEAVMSDGTIYTVGDGAGVIEPGEGYFNSFDGSSPIGAKDIAVDGERILLGGTRLVGSTPSHGLAYGFRPGPIFGMPDLPDTIDFGSIGSRNMEQRTLTFTIADESTRSAWTEIVLEADTDAFGDTGVVFAKSIAPKQRGVLRYQVSAPPHPDGAYEAKLIFTYDASGALYRDTIVLTAEIVKETARLWISTDRIDFGFVPAGESLDQWVLLENLMSSDGSLDLNVADPSTPQFSVATGGGGRTLDRGKLHAATIRFHSDGTPVVDTLWIAHSIATLPSPIPVELRANVSKASSVDVDRTGGQVSGDLALDLRYDQQTDQLIWDPSPLQNGSLDLYTLSGERIVGAKAGEVSSGRYDLSSLDQTPSGAIIAIIRDRDHIVASLVIVRMQ